MKPIPYGRQSIDQTDIDAVIEVLKSDFMTQGPKIEQFEQAFANYIGCKYAVAVSNGTAALHLAAMALNVKPGQKVITTPITFAASANCVLYCGGTIDFCDIDPATFLIDLDKLEQKLQSAPAGTYSGIIPVSFSGLAVNTQKLRKIADKYNLWIIEDACHAPGGYYTALNGDKVFCGDCQYTEAAIFSFHPVKHIATGEGGMITTNDQNIYQQLCLLRTHGITKDPAKLTENHGGWYYQMQQLGYNYRLPDLSAALGISQLAKADAGLLRRTQIADTYNKAFENTNITLQKIPQGYFHAHHLYIIKVKNRLELYNYLRKHNIYAQIHYVPVHMQPYYLGQGFKKGDYPMAEQYYEQCISLPMYPALTNYEQQYVIDKIIDFIRK